MSHSALSANHESILAEAAEKIRAAGDRKQLKDVEREYLGKKGIVAALLASIGQAPPEQRKRVGQDANRLKQAITTLVQEQNHELGQQSLKAERRGAGFDPTLPPAALETGSLHPFTRSPRGAKRRAPDLIVDHLMVVQDEQRVGPRLAVHEDADDFRAGGDDRVGRVEQHRVHNGFLGVFRPVLNQTVKRLTPGWRPVLVGSVPVRRIL